MRIIKNLKEDFISTDVSWGDNIRDLTRNLRKAIVSENGATNQYEQIVDLIRNQQNFESNETYKTIASILQDIANEEKVHIGELHKCLSLIAPDELDFYDDGMRENSL